MRWKTDRDHYSLPSYTLSTPPIYPIKNSCYSVCNTKPLFQILLIVKKPRNLRDGLSKSEFPRIDNNRLSIDYSHLDSYLTSLAIYHQFEDHLPNRRHCTKKEQ